MFDIGRVVYSKCGRDKGLVFVIIKAEGEYIYLVDGNVRKLDKPKKKKMRHVQITNYFLDGVKFDDKSLLDADIRKALLPFKKDALEVKKEVISLV